MNLEHHLQMKPSGSLLYHKLLYTLFVVLDSIFDADTTVTHWFLKSHSEAVKEAL